MATDQERINELKFELLNELGRFVEKQPKGVLPLTLLSRAEAFVKSWYRFKLDLDVRLINLRQSEDGKGIQWDKVEVV